METSFYLSCLYYVEGLEHRTTPDLERSEVFRAVAERLTGPGSRRAIREWVGDDYSLIPREWLPPPQEASESDPRLIFEGRIARVRSENDGLLSIRPLGHEIWFPPHRLGRFLFASGDEGTDVKFMIGFSYDKPRAWLTKW